MTLNRLSLVHETFELRLLELEVFFLESGLLGGLRLRLVLAGGPSEDEALIHIGNIVIIQVLRVELLEVGAWLLVWRRDQRHTLRHVLRLIYHRIVQTLVFHRLVQDFLHVHRATHMLFHVERVCASFALGSCVLGYLVQDALDVAKLRVRQV